MTTRPMCSLSTALPPAARLALRMPALLAIAGMRDSMLDKQGQELVRLQRGLTGDRHLAGAAYMDDHDSRAAYFLYYWPVSYMQTSMALTEIIVRPQALPHLRMSGLRILDIGAGPGPASAAIIDTIAAHNNDSSTKAPCSALVDASRGALALAEKMLADRGAASVASHVLNLETAPELPQGPFDIAVACHFFNEVWKEQADANARRAALARKIWASLAAGGILLVIEPAAAVTARPALELRDAILSSCPDARMLAPCTTAASCPIVAAGSQRSCHSEWAWQPSEEVAALAARAGLDRNSAKATWFAFQKISCDPKSPAHSAAHDTVYSTAWRIVSDPMLNKAGRIRYICCSKQGLATLSAHRDNTHAQEAGFFALRRGDIFMPSGLTPREGASSWGFESGASLQMLMSLRSVL